MATAWRLRVAIALSALTSVAQADFITVATWGGSYQDALRHAFFTPTETRLGVRISEDNVSTGIADVRRQVRGNSVKWDIVDLPAQDCVEGAKEGLFEPLDYSVIKTDGIDSRLVAKDWVGFLYYSVVLAYNTKAKGPKPMSWQQFWNTNAYPGRRSLGIFPAETLTIAAMADGTATDKVYPIDLDKAFAKLRALKPFVVAWWGTGTQATNLIKDNEVDYGSAWNGRVESLKAAGAPINSTLAGGVLSADCLAVPKGSKNKASAMKVAALFVSADLQANLPKYAANGPVNVNAFATGKLSPQEIAMIISSPENLKKQVMLDPFFWSDHMVDIQERWQDLVQ